MQHDTFSLKLDTVQLGHSLAKIRGKRNPPSAGGAGMESSLSSSCIQSVGGGEDKGGNL